MHLTKCVKTDTLLVVTGRFASLVVGSTLREWFGPSAEAHSKIGVGGRCVRLFGLRPWWAIGIEMLLTGEGAKACISASAILTVHQMNG